MISEAIFILNTRANIFSQGDKDTGASTVADGLLVAQEKCQKRFSDCGCVKEDGELSVRVLKLACPGRRRRSGRKTLVQLAQSGDLSVKRQAT